MINFWLYIDSYTLRHLIFSSSTHSKTSSTYNAYSTQQVDITQVTSKPTGLCCFNAVLISSVPHSRLPRSYFPMFTGIG